MIIKLWITSKLLTIVMEINRISMVLMITVIMVNLGLEQWVASLRTCSPDKTSNLHKIIEQLLLQKVLWIQDYY